MKTVLKKLPRLAGVPAVLFASVLLAASAQAQILGFVIDFDANAATYSDNFKAASDEAATGFTWNSTAGTGGGGGLTVTNTTGNNIFYRPTPASNATSTFNLNTAAAGTTFRSTTDFVWSNTTATDLTVLNVGFVPANTSINPLSEAGSLNASIIRSGSATTTLRMRSANIIDTSVTFNQSTLTAGNWYQLSYELTKTAATNEFTYTVSLFSLGADGTSSPVLFNDGSKDITLSDSITSSLLYTDTNAFFAYDIRNTNGISQVDNFSVSAIPEPSTYAFFTGLGLLLFTVGRRKPPSLRAA